MRKEFGKKSIALMMATSLLVGGVIGGTVAWLADSTDVVTNTFTESNIDITLTETEKGTDYVFDMVPGWKLDKNPLVTVEGNSEDCWLFVQVDESATLKLSDYIAYAVDTEWTQGNGTDIPANVYYREVTASDNDQSFNILGAGSHTYAGETYTWSDDEVLVKPEVTQAMMDAITEDNEPTLEFTAYAVQLYKANDQKFEAKDAWAQRPTA